MKLLRCIAAALVLLLAGAAMAEGVIPAQVGLEAPYFELETLDGETFRLSDYLGKVVYLNIWATWCPPCVAEMPDIQRLAEAYPDELVVIGASVDTDPNSVLDFIVENRLTYTFAMDADYTLANELFPTLGIPESVVIAPNGVVSNIKIGLSTYEEMEQWVRKAQALALEAE